MCVVLYVLSPYTFPDPIFSLFPPLKVRKRNCDSEKQKKQKLELLKGEELQDVYDLKKRKSFFVVNTVSVTFGHAEV